MKIIKHEDVLKKALKNKKFKKLYEEELVMAEIAVEIAERRQKMHLTQKKLAEKLHTTQQTISKWESNNYENIEIRSLQKIAKVLNAKLKIDFISKHKTHSHATA